MRSKHLCAFLVFVYCAITIAAYSVDIPVPVPLNERIHGGNNVLARDWDYIYDNDTKTITITGSGMMTDYDKEEDVPWYSYRGEIKRAVIASGIERVGNYAFISCFSLETVEIPDTLVSIGYAGFGECHSLQSFTFPDNLQSIGMVAFRTCKSLKTVSIHSNIISIGEGAFSGCEGIESFDVDPNNPYFASFDGLMIFKPESKLFCFPSGRKGSYVLPPNITKMSFGAFERTWLTSLTITGNITAIPTSCFLSSSHLESIVLPESLTSIQSQSFRECSNLKSIALPAGVVEIGGSAFYGCSQLSFLSYSGSGFSCSGEYIFSRCPLDILCAPLESNITKFCDRFVSCKSSSCESIHQQLSNKCFDVVCENNEWSIIKNATAIEWEKKTNGCVDYQCSNESGLVMKSKCDGEDTVCIDGECKSTKTTEKGWSVVIDFDESLTVVITEVNVSEIRDTLKVLCGLEFGDDIEVGIEYNSAGQVSSLIILVDDEKVAQTISSKVEEASQSTTCDIGVLCENKGITVKKLTIQDFSSMEIEGCSQNSGIMMMALLFIILSLI